jgi:hypothetical protein
MNSAWEFGAFGMTLGKDIAPQIMMSGTSAEINLLNPKNDNHTL